MKRLIIYSLRSVNDKSVLSIDLTGLIDANNPDQSTIKINLPSGLTTLKVWDYVNKDVIYDDGKHFFLICSKQASRDWAFKKLMHYAINKLDERLDKLQEAKKRYISELVAA